MAYKRFVSWRGTLGIALVGLALSLSPAVAAGVLRLPLTVDIGSFDPDNGFEIGAMSAINAVYEGLVEYAPGTTQIVGLLAKTWDVSADGLTYTFHLVEGVTFHDGTPFNAQAVVQSFERRRGGDLILSYFLGNVASLAAPDPATVVISLASKQPSFLDGLASAWGAKVISPAALAAHDDGDKATTWLNTNAVGTGPYRLAEFNRGIDYVFVRNEAYWGPAPFFDEIRLPVVPDIGQQILQLQAGEIDAVPEAYPLAQLASLPADIEVDAAPNMTQLSLFVRPGTALDDPAVRAAVATAINPALWMKDAFGDYAELSKSLFHHTMLDPAEPVAYPTDFAAASAAIARHGEVALTIGVPGEIADYSRVGELLAAQLGTIGVKATVHVMPLGAYAALQSDPNAPDLLLMILNPDAAHPENQAKTYFTKGAVLNFYGRVVPEADAVVDEAGLLTDVPRRDALYEKASHLYVDAGVAFPLVDIDDVIVHAKGLTDLGLRPAFPQGNIDFSTVRWAQ